VLAPTSRQRSRIVVSTRSMGSLIPYASSQCAPNQGELARVFGILSRAPDTGVSLRRRSSVAERPFRKPAQAVRCAPDANSPP
jgi:hypothetical protein